MAKLTSHIRSFGTEQSITDRIEHEYELDEARGCSGTSCSKSPFLDLMSHEIRTPLNAAIGALGLIDSKHLNPSQRKLLKGAESLLVIINDILDFPKMEAGILQLEPTIFDVRKTTDDVLQVLDQRALEKNISLTADLNLDVPEFLIGDASGVRHVLLHLCSNAVRFTAEGGVHISLSRPRLQDEIAVVRFQVEDTGCGVPLEEQVRLFDEFWGTSATALDKADSTGLGLPNSKQLVEMMGGSIGFESELGHSSIFWFELPFETPGEEAVKDEKK